MSPVLITRTRMPAAILTALLLVLATLVWSVTHADRAASVVPATASVGTLHTPLSSSKAGVQIRAFSFGVANTPCTSGSATCTSKANFADPSVTLDTSTLSPAEQDAVATGRHFDKVTVALFAPGTHNRYQEFVYDEVTFTSFQTSRGGNNSAPPIESIGWTAQKVTQNIYNPNTQVLLTHSCYDLVLQRRC
jgi:hypothetical protein